MSHHLLYSFRRCPYAMRARMALVSAQIQCDVHEVDFKDKPAHMLEVSEKGTVPVLITPQGQVMDESLDVMRYALSKVDPESWLERDLDLSDQLVAENDGAFKAALDRYKYPNRYPDEDCSGARDQGQAFLEKLNALIQKQGQIHGSKVTFTDIAIFPFIRQFGNVDRAWFDALNLKPLQQWLEAHLSSDLFISILQKHKENPYLLFQD